MAKLAKRVSLWVTEDLISQSQAEKILAFEKKSGKPWILYGFIMLGISVISIGIISLIAANWEDIPDGVKLFFDFAILIIMAVMIYYYYMKNRPLVFDAITALFMLFFLASIGLVAQIYHTGGRPHQALFLWAAVLLPLALFAYKNFVHFLWVLGFLAALVLLCTIGIMPEEKFFAARMGVLASLPLISGGLSNLTAKNSITKKLSFPFAYYSVVITMGAVVVFDIMHSIHGNYDSDLKDVLYIYSPLYLVLFLSAALAAVTIIINKSLNKRTRFALLTLGAGYTIMLMLPIVLKNYYHYGYFSDELSSALRMALSLTGPAVFIIMMFLLCFLLSSLDNKRLFNLCLRLIGLRFLIIYFQVFGSLAYTGIGLIISGLLIIGIVVAWYKNHEKIEKWFGGLIK